MTNPIDDPRVVTWTLAGWSAPQIAAALKCSSRTVQRARARAGVTQPPTSINYLTAEEVAQVEELLADGCSLREAARTIGRHPDSLYKNRRFAAWRWSRLESAQYAGLCSRMSKAGKFFNPSSGSQG